jgi:AraC family transcriptional regulator
MYIEEIEHSIIFHLMNTAYLQFDCLSIYPNIISPFSRIYYIEQGEGTIVIGSKKTKLEAGYLYLIPSFTFCTYTFNQDLAHYYIHFGMNLNNGMSLYNLFSIQNKVAASELDINLFKRLLEITPNSELPHRDPNVYQTKYWMNKKISYPNINQYFESNGIIEQIFSRFLDSPLMIQAQSMLRYNLQTILVFIQNNLENDISVEQLAEMAFLSKDHFSRVFKSIIGMAPCEFIIMKRLEKAQFLLLTTDLTFEQIIEKTNFKTASYFSRIFKKYTSCTPIHYRKQRG